MRRWLCFILTVYLMLGMLHGLATPVMEAWDEPWHYPVVKYLADNGLQLPVQAAANTGPWRQQGGQPPLYYLLSAVMTTWIDTSDMETLRRMNPHAAIGVAQPDGNANLIVHRTDLEAFPWRGTTLAVYVVRLFSLLLGAVTIWITYQLGRELFPDQPLIAVGAAALNALLPMFLFISASVSNDTLSNLIGNGLTLLVVRLLKRETLPNWRHYVLLGVAMGAGLLSKLSLGFFIPIIALTLLILTVRLRNWRPLVIGGVISGGLTILIAGWWYLRNYQLYGDPTGLNVFLDIIGRRVPPANWAQLWTERFSFSRSYWGAYGSINILLPDFVYTFFDLMGIFALLSVTVFLIKTLARREWSLTQWLPAGVTLLWIIVTFISLLRWTTETPASQGRLIFVALSSLSVWMTAGLTWWLPRTLRALPVTAVVGAFALVAVVAPFAVIAPAYALPAQIPSGDPEAVFTADDGTEIGLLTAEVQTVPAQPGEMVFLNTDWQIVSPTSRDWSLFVHLVTSDGVIVAQRDTYPGSGKLATSDLEAGYAWSNAAAVPLPITAYAPNTLSVQVGWYDHATGERLQLLNEDETVTVGTVEVEPRASTLDVPNPLHVNFDDQIELVGYDLTSLSAAPGETVELTLYWRGLRNIERDYVVFANIINPESLTKYADSNAMPAAWSRPTTTWQTGEIISDTHTLTIYPDAAPGIYEVEIGLYLQEDGFPRLRIVPEVGDTAENYLHLTRFRVTEGT